MRTATRAFTLVEVVAVVAIVGLAAGIVLPRLPGAGTLRVEDAAWRLAERLSATRERAILGGRSLSIALADDLAAGIRVTRVEVGGMVRSGTTRLDLGADGDALVARVTLVDESGARAVVVVPPGMRRARVAPEDGA